MTWLKITGLQISANVSVFAQAYMVAVLSAMLTGLETLCYMVKKKIFFGLFGM